MSDPTEADRPSRLWRREAPRNAAALAFLAGVADLSSVLLPERAEFVTDLRHLIPGGVTASASIVAAASGVALLLLAGGLRRRSLMAYRVALLLLVGSAAAHIVRGVDLVGSALESFVAGYLFAQADQFIARSSVREKIPVVWPGLVVILVTLVYGYSGLSLPASGDAVDASTWGKVQETARMAIGLGTSFRLHHHFRTFFPQSVAALFYAGTFFVVVRALAPVLRHGTKEAVTTDEAIEADDSLAWFATRDDHVAVRGGGGAVSYGRVGTVALASGDPLGPPSSWGAAVAAFLDQARAEGRVAAVLGCGFEAAKVYRRHGLYVRYLGDEAVLDLRTFSVDAAGMKVARQSWNRARRAGFTATAVRARDLDEGAVAALRKLSDQWRGQQAERGFSMALGRLFDERDGEAVVVVGRDAEGEIAGFFHLVPWGRNGVSLDVMRRDRGAPGYFNDYLVVEAARLLPELGIEKLSLNFSFLRAVVAPEAITDEVLHRRWRLRAQRWMLRKLSARFQIESLYRFNKKFAPEWRPRYFAMEAVEDTPRVLFAAMRAEGLIAVRSLGRGRRELGSAPGEAPAPVVRDSA